MDDYKRTLYMIALRDLQELQRTGSPKREWLCVQLATVLRHERQASAGDYIGPVDDLVQEFFPDFLALYDGSYWTRRKDTHMIHNQRYSAVDAAWWQQVWLEPRIRILECLLRD
jgi:hypothetical protein